MLVAVVGSGAGGLTAIKCCKEEGLDVVCYERSDNIGGLWRYRDQDEEGLASVTKSTVINTSKELTSYSDFPPPEQFPNYMHNSSMFVYLKMYAEKFDLVACIKFHHRVESIVPADDYRQTGRWKITVVDLKTREERCSTVDAVMVCTGHHVFPNMPTFAGQEKFKGVITHTHSYKKPREFEDKRVVVVGAGNSAGDAAVETSLVAKQVYLSTRRGCWVMHRVAENGKPYDDIFTTRLNNLMISLLPLSLSSSMMESVLNRRFDHEKYQLKPKHRFLQQHPMTNDALPNRILSGTVIVKGDIKHFQENGVLFEGDSEITEVDSVILATGYEIKFPFLSKEILDTTENRVQLYKFIFPPHLKHPTLAMVGLFQSLGGGFPIAELQCRWIVQLLRKNLALPSEQEMKKDVRRQLENIRRRYYDSKRNTIQVDYINYADELASLIGAKPNFFKMFFNDNELFRALMTGPSLPYQYRLQGPHKWSKARHTILSYSHRADCPLQTRFKNIKRKQKHFSYVRFTFLIVFVAFVFLNLFVENSWLWQHSPSFPYFAYPIGVLKNYTTGS
ncbi:flavin-containing monooxygenase 5-like [Centruroides vittatus]|uniref:flavin-containing monooxygenase 5-like n=1 Tax=Centruroides vittatus TaxID=120091 RepID=UPI00350EAE4B